jgi:hypothetical protein
VCSVCEPTASRRRCAGSRWTSPEDENRSPVNPRICFLSDFVANSSRDPICENDRRSA